MLSSALQAVGFTVAYLCEYQPQLKNLLAHKFPGANVQPDVDATPWVQWAAAGGRALLVVAGIACQPFSRAGRMLGSRDKRAFQALKVLEAAIALHASYILLENVPGLVDNNDAHGVFSIICYRYASAGYEMCQVLRLNHSECAGGTIRERIFILFTAGSAPRVTNFDVQPTACLAASLPELHGTTTSIGAHEGQSSPILQDLSQDLNCSQCVGCNSAPNQYAKAASYRCQAMRQCGE